MENFQASQVDIEYLKQENIGKVIAKSLAVLYDTKPKFPVDFLSKWLMNYSVQQESEKQLREAQLLKEDLQKKHQRHIAEEKKRAEEEERKIKADQEVDEQYRAKVQNELFHGDLLVKDFPNFLELRKQLTGVYVGQLGFPTKPISDEDEGDENAHLNQAEAAVINYTGSSDSHHSLIIGKVLEREKGVTADVFKEEAAQDADDDPNAPVVVKPTYVYVPDVVKEPRMHFFRLPKLGAYIAIPLVYNSCLFEGSFDAALEERFKYRQAKEAQDRERETRTIEIQEKLKEMTDNGEDVSEFESAWKAEQEAWEDVREADFVTVKREYVVCGDTLGQDREISAEDRAYLESYVKYFAKAWEETEKAQLSADVDRQIRHIESLPAEWTDIVAQYKDQEEKAAEEKAPQLDEVRESHPKEYEYEIECSKLERVKELLQDKAQALHEHFVALTKYRVLKFPQILQNILYLLGWTREKINIPGTHIFDWKNQRDKLADAGVWEAILKYSHRGPKPSQVKPYALVNRILQKVEKYDQEQVDQYSLVYGRLLRWLRLTCTLRKQDIEIRRKRYEAKVAEREARIAEKEKLAEDKEKAREEKRVEIPEEEQETFDWGEWEKLWDEEHPVAEIPEEVQLDVDEDCEFE